MSNIPANLLYTKDHEWVRLEGDTAVVGITDYAQTSLGDVTFADLPDVGDTFAQHDTFGAVESVKAASDLYMPVSCEVLEVNSAVNDDPALVNQDPYGAAWMVKVKLTNPAEIASLLSAADYAKLV